MGSFVGLVFTLALVLVSLFVLTRLVSGVRPHVSIRDHERGLLYASGQFVRVLEPGGHWMLLPFRRIRDLELSGIGLVVLSACKSLLGHSGRGAASRTPDNSCRSGPYDGRRAA